MQAGRSREQGNDNNILTLGERIEELAEKQPEKAALICKEEQVSYALLDRRIKAAGTLLMRMHVKKGDRVLFTTLSRPEMPVVYLGIQQIGAVAVFVDKNATPENAAAIYEDTDACLFLTDKPMQAFASRCRLYSLRAFCAAAAELADEPHGQERAAHCPDDIAEMIFTTGTTGRPKGVMLSYRALRQIWRNNIAGVGATDRERMLLALPLCHSLGLRVLRMTLYLGATVVLQNGFTFARELEKNIVEKDCTAMVTVPASLALTKNQMGEDFSAVLGRLRLIEVGAGSLSPRQKKEFHALLPCTRLINTWGSSETGGAIFLDVHAVAEDAQKVQALGKPLPGIKVSVLGSEGEPLPETDAQHPGRLALEGDMLMSGYWNRPELTRDSLRDGTLVTNDLVWTDREGYVYMLGRADDIINVGGEKVSPVEVENIAGEYPPVRECACIGVPDPQQILGQVPVLLLAVDETFADKGLEGLKTFLAGKMERIKLPAAYLFVEALPRNRMKKPDRKAMRGLWEAQNQ